MCPLAVLFPFKIKGMCLYIGIILEALTNKIVMGKVDLSQYCYAFHSTMSY